MRAALEFALQGFKGAVILVTHDRHLLRNCIDELYLVDAGKVRLFENDLHDYEQWILSDKREVAVQSKTPERELGGNKKAQRQDAATRRAQLQPLQKAVKQAEKAMGETESALSAIREKLADETLYSAERKQDLTELLAEESRLARALSEHEEAWLLAQEALEEAEQPFKVSEHRN
jgi:ATP-binding cassette subfamily F protein 3